MAEMARSSQTQQMGLQQVFFLIFRILARNLKQYLNWKCSIIKSVIENLKNFC